MIIRAAQVHPYDLPFRRPIRTRHGEQTHRRGFLLQLPVDNGISGFGEACTFKGFGSATPDLKPHLEALTAQLPGETIPTAPAELELWAAGLSPLVEIRAALICAALDAQGRAAERPMADLLGGAKITRVGVGALARDADDAKAHVSNGFWALKVKVGAQSIEEDAARLLAIRDAVGPDIEIRADANGAWGKDEAARALELFAKAKPAFIEEPLTAPDAASLAWLSKRTPIAVALDETLTHDGGVALLEAYDDGVAVLKPTVVGGPLRAVAIAEEASRRGWRVTVGTLFESAVGRRAAWHVAAAIGTSLACGLGSVFSADVSDARDISEGGYFGPPPGPGLGLDVILGGTR